ncbi:ATP synthase F0 subcomplex subunit OSCP atp5 [Borealophlyctis nickersoniae]|nr:ATP synthase F0 subcomplex subunit OSCP atp5 [Borealophlyctis nickersoniae]
MSFLNRTASKVVRSPALAASVRTYASSAPAAVQVPLTLHGIDGRYATALFSAAAKKNALPTVEQDLTRLRTLIEKDAGVRTFFSTPLADRSVKSQAVKSIVSQGRYSELTQNFLNVLAENGRLDQMNKVIAAFEQLMTAHRGEVAVTVTSAKDLDSRTQRQLRDILQRSSLISKDSKLVMSTKVDPGILGGLIIEMSEKTIDLSVSSKINKLNRLLAEAI